MRKGECCRAFIRHLGAVRVRQSSGPRYPYGESWSQLWGEVEQTPRESRRAGGSENNWWRRLVEVAAVIAAPAAVFYVAGLVAFWVQLSNEYKLPGTEYVWIAASLVSKSTAAGLGVQTVMRGLVVALALATVLLSAAYIVLKLKPRQQDHSDSETPAVPAWVLPVSTFMVGGLVYIIVSTQDTTPVVFTVRFTGALAVAYLLNFYLYWNLGGAPRAAITKSIAFYPKWLHNLIVVLGILCVGGSVLFPGEASLPCLYRETTQGDVMNGEVLSAMQAAKYEDFRTLEGGFLGHSQGYWYVLDEEHLQLEAIPDDDAKRILEDEFYIAHTRIGRNGKPVGERMTEEQAEKNPNPGRGYQLSGACHLPTE